MKSVDNAHIVLQNGSAHLAADKLRVKYEMKLATCQSVKRSLHRLHKVIDDTIITRLQLETEIDTLFMRTFKRAALHEEEP